MQGYFACNLLPSLRIFHGKYCAVIIFVILPAFSFYRNYIYGRRNFVSANKRWRECDRDQSFFCFHIYIISCFEKLSDAHKASCWGRKISFSKEIKWIMRVIAQDVRLCLRHAELSLARGFGNRDGGMGRAREGVREGWHGAWFRTGLVPGHDTSGPVYPQRAHTQCSKHMSGKCCCVFWSCHIIYITVLYKLKAICRFVAKQ